MALIDKAIAFAAIAHENQIDKVGEPYILHPIRVMLCVTSEKAKIVAILHDVLEDTLQTAADFVSAGFDGEILGAVQAITKVKGEAYDEYLKRVKANPLAREVKIADIRDNASPIRLYKLAPETIQRLTAKYSKALKFMEGWE
jgi:(p)ppGpp synthase/HD superfamily hydrolase